MRFASAFGICVLAFVTGCGGGDDESASHGPNDTPEQSAPKNAVGGFSIEVPVTTLESGDEMQPCWVFPIELDGDSHFVAAGSVTVGEGMHHGNVTTRKK